MKTLRKKLNIPYMYLPLNTVCDSVASWTTAFPLYSIWWSWGYVSPPVFKKTVFDYMLESYIYRSNFYCNKISFYCKWMSWRPQSLRGRNKHSGDWVCKNFSQLILFHISMQWNFPICYCFYFNYFISALVTVVHRFWVCKILFFP